jgi:lipopolysaccharide export LptBFGC system permease protein LptF
MAAARAQELALYLVPQALPIALPLGLFIGLIYGFRARVMSLRPRMALMIAAILCSIASFAALAWIVPVSNQAFRVAASSDPFIPKGLPELTLGELRSRIADNQHAASTYHSRWALSATPIVLTAWAFLLIGRLPGGRRWLPGIVAIASCVAYALLMDTGRAAVNSGTLPPIAGAWLPNGAFVGALILLAGHTPRDEYRGGAVVTR